MATTLLIGKSAFTGNGVEVGAGVGVGETLAGIDVGIEGTLVIMDVGVSSTVVSSTTVVVSVEVRETGVDVRDGAQAVARVNVASKKVTR